MQVIRPHRAARPRPDYVQPRAGAGTSRLPAGLMGVATSSKTSSPGALLSLQKLVAVTVGVGAVAVALVAGVLAGRGAMHRRRYRRLSVPHTPDVGVWASPRPLPCPKPSRMARLGSGAGMGVVHDGGGAPLWRQLGSMSSQSSLGERSGASELGEWAPPHGCGPSAPRLVPMPSTDRTIFHEVEPSAPATAQTAEGAAQVDDAQRDHPLLAAVMGGNEQELTEAVAAALEGGDAGGLLAATDSVGRSLLHLAARAGHAEAVRMLMRCCCAEGCQGRPALSSNRADARGHTPLHLAAAYGRSAAAQALLAPNQRGVFLEALEGEEDAESSSLECCAPGGALILEQGGAGALVAVCPADASGRTPLHLAAHYHCDAMVTVLLRAGGWAALRRRDAEGNTPLHTAAQRGASAALRIMLQRCLTRDAAEQVRPRSRVYINICERI